MATIPLPLADVSSLNLKTKLFFYTEPVTDNELTVEKILGNSFGSSRVSSLQFLSFASYQNVYCDSSWLPSISYLVPHARYRAPLFLFWVLNFISEQPLPCTGQFSLQFSRRTWLGSISPFLLFYVHFIAGATVSERRPPYAKIKKN